MALASELHLDRVRDTEEGISGLGTEWMHPGLQITAMESDQAGKNKPEAAAIGRAMLYVYDRTSPGDDVTICDLTGTGAQGTAVATFALQAAHAASAGTLMKA